MTRTVFAITAAVSILLFVWQYAEFTDRIRPAPIMVQEQQSSGTYDLQVTCTCDCIGNEFGKAAMLIEFRGRTLLENNELVKAGESIVLRDVEGIVVGPNDFLVQVTPVESSQAGAFSLNTDSGDGGIARAVQVQVLRDGHVVASQLIWSGQGGQFGELIRIEVPQ